MSHPVYLDYEVALFHTVDVQLPSAYRFGVTHSGSWHFKELAEHFLSVPSASKQWCKYLNKFVSTILIEAAIVICSTFQRHRQLNRWLNCHIFLLVEELRWIAFMHCHASSIRPPCKLLPLTNLNYTIKACVKLLPGFIYSQQPTLKLTLSLAPLCTHTQILSLSLVQLITFITIILNIHWEWFVVS